MANNRCEECGSAMDLIWDENIIICPKCGRTEEISDEEKVDFEGDSDVSYCNVCEHSGEYPSCIGRCPYDD